MKHLSETNRLRRISVSLLLLVAAVCTVPAHAEKKTDAPKKVGWVELVEQQIEGWPVQVDAALLSGEHKQEGERALKMLANHLQRIAILIPEKSLVDLRKMGIRIEHHHPELANMQYHPDLDWLVERGYDPQLAKKVHIPRASDLVSRKELLKHPAVILHELAHAYHDQILTFDDQGLIDAYNEAMKKGIYDKSLLYNGEHVKHYATTDNKEYFAEATEAYFYHNDFYPFVRAELKLHDPRAYAEIKRAWRLED